MSAIGAEQVKTLRDKTGAGMMDCKTALQKTAGDMEKAIDHLRKKGLSVAAKRGSKATSEGRVTSYIHAGGKIGVMVEINCETDFVSNTDDFQELAKDIAMQIAASNPLSIKREDVSQDVINREREIFTSQAKESGKPEKVIERIVDGKLEKYFKEVCLLEQNFVKNPDITVEQRIQETIGKLGENIVVKRFCRYQLGEK